MIVDRTLLQEYPFHGSIYRYGVDESKPLDEQVEEEMLVLDTMCDIQSAQKSDASGNITAYFNIYAPLDKEKGIAVKRGDKFKGSIYGLEVNGEVISVEPSQLGGVVFYVKDLDV